MGGGPAFGHELPLPNSFLRTHTAPAGAAGLAEATNTTVEVEGKPPAVDAALLALCNQYTCSTMHHSVCPILSQQL